MMKRITTFIFVMVCFLVLSKPVLAEDYFIPPADPTQKAYLRNAEVNHLDKVMPHLSAGRIQYAIDELRYTLNAFPNHPRALMLLTIVEKVAKKANLGVVNFERALSLYPQYAITHAQYGWYLVESGNLEAGIFKLKQAIEMDAKLVAPHVWLARAYSKSGNAELARQTAEQARALGYNGQIPGVN
jgi:Tfp pilus assembly protein PilF